MGVEGLLPELRRARVIWVEVPGRAARLAWTRWLDDALYVVHGGAEQEVPDLAAATTVTLVTTTGRRCTAEASVVGPDDPAWAVVAPRLHAARHNPPSDPGAWRTSSVLTRLRQKAP